MRYSRQGVVRTAAGGVPGQGEEGAAARVPLPQDTPVPVLVLHTAVQQGDRVQCGTLVACECSSLPTK